MGERDSGTADPVRLGIAGLGLAGSFMIRAAAAHPGFRLCAAMDPLPRPRQAFSSQFGARVYSEFQGLCEDPEVEGAEEEAGEPRHERPQVNPLRPPRGSRG